MSEPFNGLTPTLTVSWGFGKLGSKKTTLELPDDWFVFVREPARLAGRLRKITRGFPYATKLWQDAYLAALAIEAGLRLVTIDKKLRSCAIRVSNAASRLLATSS